MKKSILTRCTLVIFTVLLCFHWTAVPALANSARSWWEGVSSTGSIITDEDCPIVVERELLTFDLQEFPEQYYSELSDYLDYAGKVTAEYTFYNPSDYTVTATLVFPFGKAPDYGYTYNYQTEERVTSADAAKYQVMVNGDAVDTIVRHTLSYPYSDFDLETDMPRLIDGYVEDSFYRLDLPVTKYTYVIRGLNEECRAATAAFFWNEDPAKTKILLVDQCGGDTLDDGVLVQMWAENDQTVVLYLFGELPGEAPDWKFYENGACEKEVSGTIALLETETMTFEDYVMASYSQDSGILVSDWYNAAVAELNRSEWSYGVEYLERYGDTLETYLLRWYEYQIVLEPGERITNTVTAPIYPAIDINYDPSIYEYTYLLSPAQTWSSFGELEIVIHTPYYMTDDNQNGFIKTDTGYTLTLDGLPEEELEFTLSTSEAPQKPARHIRDYIPVELLISFSIIVIVIVAGCILLTGFLKKKKSNDLRKT